MNKYVESAHKQHDEQADIDWHNQQERLKRADTEDYYSDFDKTEGRGLLLNRESWICDDCQLYRNYPDRKWKSLNCNKDFHLGIYVCDSCRHKHGYAYDYCSVEYFNEAWELGIDKFDNCVWILPQKAKALHRYLDVIKDLDRLAWTRRKEYGKYDAKVSQLEKIKHKLVHENDLWAVECLTIKEKFDIVFGRRELSPMSLFVPQNIYQNNRKLSPNMDIVYPEGIK